MRVIPVGYGNAKHRDLIARLMQDEAVVLVDIRFSKCAAIPGWHGNSLQRKYGDRYAYRGAKLGNRNYKTPGAPIEIVDLDDGLLDLYALLYGNRTALLLCGCGNYDPTPERPFGCHRKMVAEAASAQLPGVEIVMPETIIAREQVLETLRDEREALYLQLNNVTPPMADYWRLSTAQQAQVRQQVGK